MIEEERKDKEEQEEKDKEALASSPSTDPSTPLNSSFKSNCTPEQVQFPTMKCPNPKCSRYLISSRIAQHLDKCIGISSRQSSRNAMTKMSTPQESRANTPKPSSQVLKRARADIEATNGTSTGGDSPPKKKVKTLTKNKATDNKPAASSKLKNGETVSEKKVTAGKTTAKKKPGRPLGGGKKKSPARDESGVVAKETPAENGEAQEITIGAD